MNKNPCEKNCGFSIPKMMFYFKFWAKGIGLTKQGWWAKGVLRMFEKKKTTFFHENPREKKPWSLAQDLQT